MLSMIFLRLVIISWLQQLSRVTLGLYPNGCSNATQSNLHATLERGDFPGSTFCLIYENGGSPTFIDGTNSTVSNVCIEDGCHYIICWNPSSSYIGSLQEYDAYVEFSLTSNTFNNNTISSDISIGSQTYTDDNMVIDFCTQLSLAYTDDHSLPFSSLSYNTDNNNNSYINNYNYSTLNQLTMIVAYDTTDLTKITIHNITTTTVIDDSNLIYSNQYLSYKQTSSGDSVSNANQQTGNIFITHGCYQITFNNTASNDNGNDLIHHGSYTILINNETVSYGGYYSNYETSIICTQTKSDIESNNIHESYCITPSYCTNNNEIWLTSSEESQGYTARSYKSMVNSTTNADTDYSLDCFGSYSCLNIYKPYYFSGNDASCWAAFGCVNGLFDMAVSHGVYCYGTYGCLGIETLLTENWNIYGTQSIVDVIVDTGVRSKFWFYGSLNMINVKLMAESEAIYIWLNDGGYMSLYNATLVCEQPVDAYGCFIYCEGNTNPFWINFDETCADYNCTFVDSDCNGIESEEELIATGDDVVIEMIGDLYQLLEDVRNVYEPECNLKEEIGSVSEDIGYALFAESDIVNDVPGATVCCRGYQSCAYTDAVSSDLGHILCLGYESCIDVSLISTGLSIDNNVDGTNTNNASIFCLSDSACTDSNLESNNDILCTSFDSCQNTFILSAKRLFCTKDACTEAVIRKVETIYFIDSQTDATVYSGFIGETSIHFRGKDSGANVKYYCNNGDSCTIDCRNTNTNDTACNSETTVVYCYGKCNIICSNDDIDDNNNNNNGPPECVSLQLSLNPTAAPTTSPTLAPTIPPTGSPTIIPTKLPSFTPTFTPTDVITETVLTQQQVSSFFNWALAIIVCLTAMLILLGLADAKQMRKNDLFVWQALLIFAFYTFDFISDAFFSLRLYIFAAEMQESDKTRLFWFYFVMFILSLSFIVIPVFGNILQLQKEISKWLSDPNLQNTDVPHWLKTNFKLLFVVTFICGSSFSAVALFNTNLFCLSLFSMGLSRYHRSVFQRKRFFSIVLLENIPQLLIQMATLYVSIMLQNGNISDSAITIFSMLFTIISISLSIFEFLLSSKIIKQGSILVLSFNVESIEIAQRTRSQFNRTIVFYRNNKICHSIAKTLQLADKQIERLKPKQYPKGAVFTIFIEANPKRLNLIRKCMIDSISNRSFVAEIKNVYQLSGRVKIPLDLVRVRKLEDILSPRLDTTYLEEDNYNYNFDTSPTPNHDTSHLQLTVPKLVMVNNSSASINSETAHDDGETGAAGALSAISYVSNPINSHIDAVHVNSIETKTPTEAKHPHTRGATSTSPVMLTATSFADSDDDDRPVGEDSNETNKATNVKVKQLQGVPQVEFEMGRLVKSTSQNEIERNANEINSRTDNIGEKNQIEEKNRPRQTSNVSTIVYDDDGDDNMIEYVTNNVTKSKSKSPIARKQSTPF